MNTRIKLIRKHLGLTQQEFAERIGSAQNTITGYETGRRAPSNQVIALICREFSVREEWLRTGEGEMFAPAPSAALDALARERGLSHGAYIAIEQFLGLDSEIREGIIKYFTDVAAALNADAAPSSAAPALGSAEDLHAELDRQLAVEKEAVAK